MAVIAPPVMTRCCPRFDPEDWQDREIVWQEKPFYRDHVTCLLYIPMNMERTVRKAMARIRAAGAQMRGQPLMLWDDQSAWAADLLIEVAREAPGLNMARLSGTFLTRVFEGPYRESPAWALEMTQYVAEKGHTLEKTYFGYTTCPKCAEAYGKNYVILFAQVAREYD
jgi:hypothetical protein